MTKRILAKAAAPIGALALAAALAACDPVEPPEAGDGQQPGGMQDSMQQGGGSMQQEQSAPGEGGGYSE